MGKGNSYANPFPSISCCNDWEFFIFLSFPEKVGPMAGYNIVGGESNLNEQGGKTSRVPLVTLKGSEGNRMDST
jgi:hypothetical protein